MKLNWILTLLLTPSRSLCLWGLRGTSTSLSIYIISVLVDMTMTGTIHPKLGWKLYLPMGIESLKIHKMPSADTSGFRTGPNRFFFRKRPATKLHMWLPSRVVPKIGILFEAPSFLSENWRHKLVSFRKHQNDPTGIPNHKSSKFLIRRHCN